VSHIAAANVGAFRLARGHGKSRHNDSEQSGGHRQASENLDHSYLLFFAFLKEMPALRADTEHIVGSAREKKLKICN